MVGNTPPPKVSIVIPVYNGANYLKEAIDSALAQTYNNLEIVVVNDGSNDNGATEKIALSYGNKVRYFSKPNGGVASALNLAIKEMTGEYFSWLSHDDLYYPDKIEQEVKVALNFLPDIYIIYSDFSVFTTNKEQNSLVRVHGGSPKNVRYRLIFENFIHGCTVLIPKAAFEECGLFNEELRATQDYELWFRMAKTYRFLHIDKILVNTRRHAQQGSVTMSDITLIECNNLLIRLIKELTIPEITNHNQHAPSVAFQRIADNMWKRDFKDASRFAYKLALQTAEPTRILVLPIKRIIVKITKFATDKVKKYLPPFIKTIIKGIFYRIRIRARLNQAHLIRKKGGAVPDT